MYVRSLPITTYTLEHSYVCGKLNNKKGFLVRLTHVDWDVFPYGACMHACMHETHILGYKQAHMVHDGVEDIEDYTLISYLSIHVLVRILRLLVGEEK